MSRTYGTLKWLCSETLTNSRPFASSVGAQSCHLLAKLNVTAFSMGLTAALSPMVKTPLELQFRRIAFHRSAPCGPFGIWVTDTQKSLNPALKCSPGAGWET